MNVANFVAALSVIIFLALAGIASGPAVYVSFTKRWKKLTAAEAERLISETRKAWIGGVGAIGFIVTATLSWTQIHESKRQAEQLQLLTQNQDIAERISRAYERLASQSWFLRFGAMLDFRRIAMEHKPSRRVVVDALSAFVRARSREAGQDANAPRDDIEEALKLISDLRSDGYPDLIDLRSANLHGLNLSDRNLSNVYFAGAILLGTQLRRVNFTNTSLYKAQLSPGTDLGCADLRNAQQLEAIEGSPNMSAACVKEHIPPECANFCK